MFHKIHQWNYIALENFAFLVIKLFSLSVSFWMSFAGCDSGPFRLSCWIYEYRVVCRIPSLCFFNVRHLLLQWHLLLEHVCYRNDLVRLKHDKVEKKHNCSYTNLKPCYHWLLPVFQFYLLSETKTFWFVLANIFWNVPLFPTLLGTTL